MNRQRPLSLREALALALENNKDIEVARHNVKIAEFDLTAARGAYDPRFGSSSYYERIESPISSFLSGGSNGSTTQSDYTAHRAARRSDSEIRRQLSSRFFVRSG